MILTHLKRSNSVLSCIHNCLALLFHELFLQVIKAVPPLFLLLLFKLTQYLYVEDILNLRFLKILMLNFLLVFYLHFYLLRHLLWNGRHLCILILLALGFEYQGLT